MAPLDSVKGTLPAVATELRPRTRFGAGSLFCCPNCMAWTRNCGVGYCAQETLTARAQRRAARETAVNHRVFLERWNATKPPAVPA